MRKLIVLTFLTLDGVMQAPGGPEEDSADDFLYGGWSVGYWDALLEKTMGFQMGHAYELLLGRRTYDIFEAAWPSLDPASEINSCRKYVVTHRPIAPMGAVWKNATRIDGDVGAAIRALKAQEGPELQVHGSSNLIQTLLREDLVDEFWLKIYPVALGRGKRLFGEGTKPAGFETVSAELSPSGVIVTTLKRNGAIRFGSF